MKYYFKFHFMTTLLNHFSIKTRNWKESSLDSSIRLHFPNEYTVPKAPKTTKLMRVRLFVLMIRN